MSTSQFHWPLLRINLFVSVVSYNEYALLVKSRNREGIKLRQSLICSKIRNKEHKTSERASVNAIVTCERWAVRPRAANSTDGHLHYLLTAHGFARSCCSVFFFAFFSTNFRAKKDCSQPSLRAGNSQIGFVFRVMSTPANALVSSDTYTSRHSVTAVREILEGLQWGGEQRTFSFSGVVILKYKVDRISMASKWQT